jgi:hypothetical protein
VVERFAGKPQIIRYVPGACFGAGWEGGRVISTNDVRALVQGRKSDYPLLAQTGHLEVWHLCKGLTVNRLPRCLKVSHYTPGEWEDELEAKLRPKE